jgi:hypothetical protein
MSVEIPWNQHSLRRVPSKSTNAVGIFVNCKGNQFRGLVGAVRLCSRSR